MPNVRRGWFGYETVAFMPPDHMVTVQYRCSACGHVGGYLAQPSCRAFTCAGCGEPVEVKEDQP